MTADAVLCCALWREQFMQQRQNQLYLMANEAFKAGDRAERERLLEQGHRLKVSPPQNLRTLFHHSSCPLERWSYCQQHYLRVAARCAVLNRCPQRARRAAHFRGAGAPLR